MSVATLKEATKELGISFDDVVHYYVKGNKGIIEVSLAATDHEIEALAVHDISEDYLSEEELNYYLTLENK